MYSTNTTLSREEFADLLEKWTDKYVNNMTPDQLREHVAEDLFNTMWGMRKYNSDDEVFEEMINWGGEDLFNEVVS
jgi:hypothetical protein